MSELSTDQRIIYDRIHNGENMLITGSAGTGKSFLLGALQQRYGIRGIDITASTGIAAVNVGGMTINSWAGLGLADDHATNIAANLCRKKNAAYKRIRECKRLVIDEVSMIHGDLFELIDTVFQLVRGNDEPFGGMQLILTGDFCLKNGTRIIMSDGSIRAVEDVLTGDYVMGPDSLPRRVTGMFRGSAELYEVKQTNGDTYTTTGNHMLALRRRRQAHRFPHIESDCFIKAIEMVKMSGKFKEVFGGFKAGCLQLPSRAVRLDPYFLGVWLGDGEKTCPRITSADPEILAYCQQYAASMGLLCKHRLERDDTKCLRISLTTGKPRGLNPILENLKFYSLIGNKHIPADFLLNSEENRLLLLAGLLDTDGCWSGNRFVYCSTIKRLADDFKQLADHLGFRAAMRRNSADEAWEVTVGGDTWRIPTRIKRKKSVFRNLGRSRLNSTLSVKPVGEGEFSGFSVDGDHCFLLADGTVTHNCQLPPVARGKAQRFAFQSEAWEVAQISVGMLRTVFRQKDEAFSGALNRIRVGDLGPDVLKLLRSRYKAYDTMPGIDPVIVYTHNEDVETMNAKKLEEIPGPAESFSASEWGDPGPLQMLQKHCLAPQELQLKIGAQVMLLWNEAPAAGLANGSIGRVVDFKKNLAGFNAPVVDFRGQLLEIEKRNWEIKSGGVILACRTQYPLRLAWSITAHKSQGMTMDKIQVHLSRAFEYGQSYVALSRSRTLDGLFIESTCPGCIKAHPQAVEFYERNATGTQLPRPMSPTQPSLF